MADVGDSYGWLILYDALLNVGYRAVFSYNNMNEVL